MTIHLKLKFLLPLFSIFSIVFDFGAVSGLFLAERAKTSGMSLDRFGESFSTESCDVEKNEASDPSLFL